MKSKIIISVFISSLFFITCKSEKPKSSGNGSADSGAVVQLTTEAFKKVIYNYDKNKEWKYEGDKPAIIDFYADWCPPCRQLSPLVEEVAKEYSGRIAVYRVNTDTEKELAQAIGISGLPTLLFVPANGKPQFTMGYLPKKTIIKAIGDVLLIN